MHSGTVNVGGTLDASAPHGGNGGFVETSAAHVNILPDARITTVAATGQTGNWLIDPVDYTIAASGGDITGAQLSANLGTSNITILSSAGTHGGTSGDINVNDTVSWSANRLTLNAQNNININTAMHGSGNASLALEYGQGAGAAGNTSTVNVRAPVNLPTGDNFSTRQGSDGVVVNYKVITSLGDAGSVTGTDLQGINGNLNANYVLGSNIDASATAGWNAGAGFVPITGYVTVPDTGPMCPPMCNPQTQTLPFAGTFDGLGHTISNLTINRPTESNIGLFGSIQLGAAVRNLGLISGSIRGASQVGALAGDNKGTIGNSYATANINGRSSVGGLVGRNGGAISSSHATGDINDVIYVDDVGVISSIGGLVGFNNAVIDNSYSTGNVNGTNYMGGLVGSNETTGMVSNSYATGNVVGDYSYRGNYWNGGLVGFNTAQISTSYASGSVIDNIYNGGLVGLSAGGGTVTNSYWNSTANTRGIGENNNSVTATGLSAIQMQTASNFAGFNFTSTPGAAGNNWVMMDGNGSLNNAGGAGATRPMLASEYSTTINNAHQLQLMAMNLAASYTLGQNINATATGTANDVWTSGTFIPVSNLIKPFTGTFNGLNHTIDGLTINQPSTSYTGLFGITAAGSSISNVGLIGGSVTATKASYIGSLVGRNSGAISNSFTTMSVSGESYVGGLVGYMLGGTINNSYAGGTVTGATRAAGLVGRNEGAISNSYATGAVTGGNNFGLTSSNNGGVVSNSFWNIETTGTSQSLGGTGLTTAQMMQLASFSSWNDAAPNTIANTGGSGAVWRIYEGHTAPLLTSFMTGLTLSGAPDVAVSYNGNAQSGASITAPAGVFGAAASGTNAGFYNGYYSNQLGYDITGGNLTINAAVLSAISLNGTRAYDGTTDVAANIFTLSGLVNNEDLQLTGAGTIASKNVGTYNVNLGTLALGDGTTGLASNYSFAGGTQTATITPAVLSASLAAADKTYDGSTLAAPTLTIIGGLIGTETINVAGAASFNSKDVASANLVTVDSVTLADGGNGGLAGNYTLAAGQTTTAHITPKALTVDGMTAANKVYDGTTAATLIGGALSGLVSAETLAFSGQSGAFADKNVGVGKAVTVSGITLADGTGLASNYRVSNPSGLAADIARLNSVAWVGGLTGNWFDPANWANGAVPDLANVANVVIPAGVSINFNQGDAASPAQAGPVDVDSIDSAGGLSLVDGSLNVGRGLELANLDQSGGALNVIGNTVVGSFSQSGGAVANAGNFTVTEAFHQSGGSLNVSGNVGITQASGSVVLGNITAGTLGVTAAVGDITQVAGSHIVSGRYYDVRPQRQHRARYQRQQPRHDNHQRGQYHSHSKCDSHCRFGDCDGTIRNSWCAVVIG